MPQATESRSAHDTAARWGSWLHRASWALLTCWALLAAGLVVSGERHASFDDLERGVATGAVKRVEITEGLTDGSTGFSVIEAHWRRGPLGYTTQVIQSRPRGAAPEASKDVTPVITEEMGARLATSQAGLDIEHVARQGSSSSMLGWQTPAWMGWATVLLFLGTVWLLVLGPQPSRATKWAWFWLMGMAPPISVIAFLLAGGPTSALPPPRDRTRRLGGGWAFLIALVIGSALRQNS